jgi:CRP-like cAMP-binding protein
MSSSIFTDLSDEERGRATAAVRDCTSQTIPAADVRAAAAFQGAGLLVVEKGLALVERLPTRSSRLVVITLAGPAVPLLPPAPTERLRALTDVRLTALTTGAVARLLAIPRVAAVLVEGLADQLRQSHENLAFSGSIHHVDRLRAKLRQLARSHGRVVGGGVRLDLPLTHDLLAHMLGSNRETVTRMLAELESEGFLRRDRRSLVLTVPPEDLA